jgi:hypothetical protein
MSDEKRQILNMLAEKKITVDEAERLLQALDETPVEHQRHDDHHQAASGSGSGRKAKYLYISVKPKDENGRGEKINVKVPLFLLRTGLKFGAILPDSAKEKINRALGEKGIDIGKLDQADFEELVSGLSEMAIMVDDEDEKVRIYCE